MLDQCVSSGNLLQAGNQQKKGSGQPAREIRSNTMLPDKRKKPPCQHFFHSCPLQGNNWRIP
jgi:hypothetical protein